MSKLDNDKIDEVALKLSGIIGIFDLIVDLLEGTTNLNPQKGIMVDFAFFISKELQCLYQTLSGVEYNS